MATPLNNATGEQIQPANQQQEQPAALPGQVQQQIALPHWRCSNERYLRLIESGALGPEDRIELINGVITAMTPAGPEHSDLVMRLTELFAPLLPQVKMLVQGTVNLGEGQIFDPDLALLKPREGGYRDRHAGPDDILLIVEVASTSLRRDMQIKARVYAGVGIPDYWIADIENQALIVHRQPHGERYDRVETFRDHACVQPIKIDGFQVKVRDIFG